MGYDVDTTDMATLNSKALEIKQNLLILISPFDLSAQLPIARHTDRLPKTLFPNRTVKMKCTNLSFQHNITVAAVEKLENLSRSQDDAFVSSLDAFDILGLVDWMEAYNDIFVNCTSIYPSYIARVEELAKSAFNLVSTKFTPDGKFDTEVESQVSNKIRTLVVNYTYILLNNTDSSVQYSFYIDLSGTWTIVSFLNAIYSQGLLAFQDEVQDRVLDEYTENKISLLGLANEMPEIEMSILSVFRKNMKEEYDTALLSYMKSLANGVTATYLEILSVFQQGQTFFGKRVNLHEIANSLSVWRIPVSLYHFSIIVVGDL